MAQRHLSTSTLAGRFLLIVLAFFLPIMAFPVTHFLLRINWTTRALETLPFHPVSLPFITGGASVLLSCIFVSAGNFGSAYLFFTCANMSYIVLFICRNADPERILNASYLAKVPDVWEVRWSLFTILFLFFQYTLTTTLRIVGRREADLGSFARITDGVVDALGIFVAGIFGIQYPTARRPVYAECNHRRDAFLSAGDGRCSPPPGYRTAT